jgi:hypothetical protein
MSKKESCKQKLQGLEYSVEALEDEVEYLRNTISEDHIRIVDLIRENDRLTLRYEPFRPPGDEHEGFDFYELIEENEALIAKAWEYKQETIQMQQILDVERAKKVKVRNKYCGIVSFDFWPLSDWARFKIYPWSPGKTFQTVIGPFRFDWFED